ncbi:MAG: phospholipid carrier-dependent glycosyltransferase [Candidatus Latescibacteria bacterium]|nr:phospholipid carrier-dependent glycosyltransferase [Candidatus Latescibacterota bacterium]NIM64526.1 phospholipid carrier-dependent glycosyltransferase [Candidatus Latescibacterota bacterium]NIO00679.1 phospholipid carrier-dependent glycosyltransferase [Candidatus Latescibacterota bacterium]NIO27082.1 phospholipid carrier-dependent glycosyltransferase [Candidatus Latescibacterota bacterium]NIO54606.1 phospholipid carrier-dependent glycosyltransferase [Candidatus Latescibacterota bacterium]
MKLDRYKRYLRSFSWDFWSYLLLFIAIILTRIPFLRNFDLVSYDGTYYINQAKSLFRASESARAFPIGYPASIAAFLPIINDAVRAAQVVSFIASVGSVVLIYRVGRIFLSKHHAFLCALLLAITPLFIRFSLNTMSESLYIFFILLTVYFFAKGKDSLTGIALGLATITRPEALAILGGLGLLRLKTPKRLSAIVVSFALIYSINIVASYTSMGRLELLPKRKGLGVSAGVWQERERFVDQETVELEAKPESVLKNYISRFPKELYHFSIHALPFLIILAIYGVIRKPIFMIAAFLPFFIFPLFTPRSEPRFVLPFLPFTILYAYIGVEAIRSKKAKHIGYTLILLTAIPGFFINKSQLLTPLSEGMEAMKSAGIYLSDQIKPTDKIADRKPFFSFYSGGKYEEIPIGDYDKTISYLMDQDVDYLSVHHPTTCILRPALKALLHDYACINGELRLRQYYTNYSGIMIFKVLEDPGPLIYKQLTFPEEGDDATPTWSPDGRYLAFSSTRSGGGDIYVMSLKDETLEQLDTGQSAEKHPSWSPDGRSIAFSSIREGNWDIHTIDLAARKIRRITSHKGADLSPCWSENGEKIFFCSNRSGRLQIWSKDLLSGDLRQISFRGSNNYPAVSPEGNRIAWIYNDAMVVVYDLQTEEASVLPSINRASARPAWSPDGRFIAVSAMDWGSLDIYIATADANEVILLTKLPDSEGQPSWSPDGETLAFSSNNNVKQWISIISGIEPYLERLLNPIEIKRFRTPATETTNR